MAIEPGRSIEHTVDRFLLWLRVRSAIRAAATSLPPVILLTAGLLAASRIFGWSGTVLVIPFVAGAALIACVTAHLIRNGARNRIDAALVLDRRIGSREVIVTAIEAGRATASPLAFVARQRAADLLGGTHISSLAPATQWRAWRATVLSVIVMSLAVLVPIRGRTAPDPTASGALRQAGIELQKEIKPVAERLRPLAAPTAVDTLDRLEEIAEALRTGSLTSQKDALLEIDRIKTTFENLQQQAQKQSRSLDIAKALAELSGDPFAGDLAKALTVGELEQVQRQLDLMSNALPASVAEAASRASDLARLADRLDLLAAALDANGKGDLAQSLRQLAGAIRAGDMSKARELLAAMELVEAFEACGASGSCDRQARELAELLTLAKYLASGSKPPAERQGPAGSEPTSGASGPGAGRGSTNWEDKPHAIGESQLRDRQSDITSEETGHYQQRYESSVTRADGHTDTKIEGVRGSTGSVQFDVVKGPGRRERITLPLPPLGPAHAGAPEPAGDIEKVPLGYRDTVRKYFDRSGASNSSEQVLRDE